MLAMTPIIVKSVQELNKKIEILEQANDRLEKYNERLEKRIVELEKVKFALPSNTPSLHPITNTPLKCEKYTEILSICN